MPNLTTSDGLRLWYHLDGRDDAPVLVLSNSLGTDFGMWDLQIATLTERFRVLRYDTRGHGATGVPASEYTIDTLGRDVLFLADTLRIERFAFCGVSLGGLTGQWLAINAPHRLLGVALASTAAHLPPRDNWTARMMLVREQGMQGLLATVMPRFFSDEYRKQDTPFFHTMRRAFLATDPHGYAGCCAAIRDADFRPDLSSIRLPTLIIGGRLDSATPPEIGAEPLARAIVGARLEILPGAHIVNVEAPMEFTSALIRFLEFDALKHTEAA